MASVVEQTILQTKLRLLEELRQLMHLTADKAFNKLLDAGREWLTGDVDEERRVTFTEINTYLEDAVSSVTQTCDQLAGLKGKSPQEVSAGSPESKKSGKSSKSSADRGDSSSLESRMDELEKKINVKMEKLAAHQKTMETSLMNVSSRCSGIEDHFSSKFDKITNRMNRMTESIEKAVADHSARVDNIESRLKAVENALDAANKGHLDVHADLGQVQTDVLKIKYNIQDLIDQQKASDEHMKKMKEAVQDLSQVKLTVTDLMSKNPKPRVGFTALIPTQIGNEVAATIFGYQSITGNKDLSFCQVTGIFTAPVHGLYAVGLRLWQRNVDRSVSIRIRATRKSSSATGTLEQEEVIIDGFTDQANSCDFNLRLTELDVGDQLRADDWHGSRTVLLPGDSSFSCFLVA